MNQALIDQINQSEGISNRGKEWMIFACEVLKHIEHYTVPQYGDKPGDPVEKWDPDTCILQIARYAARFNRDQRGYAHQWRDMMKIAHYACITQHKMTSIMQDMCI